MKNVASLNVEVANDLLQCLKKEAIPFQAQTISQESGLDICEITVEDSYYERACDVAEKWDAERLDKAEKRSIRHCPKCGSQHLEYIMPDKFGYVCKCKDCGNDFTI